MLLKNIIYACLKKELFKQNILNILLKNIKKMFIVACGSAYHAGVTAKYVIEGIARIPVEVDLASEFRYRNPILEEGTMVVVEP